MIRRCINILAAVVSFVVLTHPIKAEALAPLYDNQLVEKVEIIVNAPDGVPVDTTAVRLRIKLKEGSFFSQTDFDSDLKALAKDFNRVEPSLESIGGKMYITLKVWPKPTIRSLEWKGNAQLSERDLRKELGISTGSVYDRRSFNEAFHKLKIYLIRQGYFEAELDYDVAVDTKTNEADITIKIDEGRAGRVRKIVFENFAPWEEQAIVDLIATKESRLWSFFTGEGTYCDDMIKQDQYTIVNYMQSKGFADAKVRIDVRESTRKSGINLVIHVDRGQRYYFGEISIEGNVIYSKEELRNIIGIKEGDGFNPDGLRDAITRITDHYGKKGYIDTVIDFEPDLDPEDNKYAVRFIISEGGQYRVGLIKIFGNCSTKTSVILHETLLVPGELFNICRLKRTEERLQNVGYFKTVNVYAVRTENESLLGENYRDVHIEVEEQSTGNFGAFAGFSDAQDIFGGINITEKNFDHSGLDRIFCDGFNAVRGGGEYAHISLSVGRKSNSYSFSWTKPYFRDTPWSVGIDINRSDNRYISDDYGIQSGGFTLYTGHQINPFLRQSYHYRLTNSVVDVHISKKLRGEAAALQDAGVSDSQNEPLNTIRRLRDQEDTQGLVSAIGTSLSYDSTDNILRPTCGYRSRLELEFAGVGGRFNFFALAYLNSYYIPVDRYSVVKFRADFRFIDPLFGTTFNDMPLDERLFIGGDNTLRGYRPYRVGPLYPATDDPQGGLSSQVLGTEFSYLVLPRVDFFTFLDAGFLGKQRWEFGELRTSVGAGLRIKIYQNSPPVTVGYGIPLNAKNDTQVKRFFFSMGGRF